MFLCIKLILAKNKIAFKNARSLHKHFKDVEMEPNVLAADAIGFAETRLCCSDENVHFALKRLRLIRLDDTEKESVNRPHHGLALYVKEYFQIQGIVKIQCNDYLNSYLLAYTAFKEGMFKLLCCTSSQKVHRQILERIFFVI